MICSSVNLDRFIRPSLPSGRTLRIFGGASGGQVIRNERRGEISPQKPRLPQLSVRLPLCPRRFRYPRPLPEPRQHKPLCRLLAQ
jgi:hypothetical protein